ncbi:MAG: SCO family protein [Vulcanimicrobiaceae bacterium]
MRGLKRSTVAAILVAVAAVVAITGFAVAHYAGQRNLAYDFTLTNSAGKPYALTDARGRAVALFFGFTHCTDVCPETLAKLVRARANLGPRAGDARIVFVTVDPKRDSPEAMASYVSRFGNGIVGLTGSPAQLAPVYRAYHVWFQIVPNPKQPADYDVSHSSGIYFIGPDGRLRALGDWTDSVGQLTHDFANLIG